MPFVYDKMLFISYVRVYMYVGLQPSLKLLHSGMFAGAKKSFIDFEILVVFIFKTLKGRK